MFTGLVEAMGSIERVEPRPLGRRLRIQTTIVEGEARPGDSIAVNGCCLTAVATDRAGFEVETVAETLARTTLGSLAAGDLVNLERRSLSSGTEGQPRGGPGGALSGAADRGRRAHAEDVMTIVNGRSRRGISAPDRAGRARPRRRRGLLLTVSEAVRRIRAGRMI